MKKKKKREKNTNIYKFFFFGASSGGSFEPPVLQVELPMRIQCQRRINAIREYIARSSRESNPRKGHVWSTWPEAEESYASLSFHEYFARKAISRGTRETFCLAKN